VVTAIFWAHTNHRTHLDVYLIVFSATALLGSAAGGRDALLWEATAKPKCRRGREIFWGATIREPKSRVWTVKNAVRVTRDRRAWDPLRPKLRPDAASY
jgi:hypothetical protein